MEAKYPLKYNATKPFCSSSTFKIWELTELIISLSMSTEEEVNNMKANNYVSIFI
jgi:hypothetical protein